jgi:uncharacterized protein (UPF0332 family)
MLRGYQEAGQMGGEEVDAFDSCLRNGRLKRIEADPEKIDKEIRTAISELSRARACFADGDDPECVIQSYFAMNRILRALLQRSGYRDTNLYSLLAGLERVYVQDGRMENHLLEILKLAKDQKDLVQEGARCGRKETRLILSGAEEAMEVAREELEMGEIPELDLEPVDEEEGEETE